VIVAGLDNKLRSACVEGKSSTPRISETTF